MMILSDIYIPLSWLWGSSGVTTDPQGSLGSLPCYSVWTGCRVPLPANRRTTGMPYPGWGRGSQTPLPMNPPRGGLVAPKDGNCCFGTCLVPELGMSESMALPCHPHHHLSSVKVLQMLAQPRTCWVMLRAMAECRTLTVNLVT